MFFFNDTATTEIYTLSLHDALPISSEEIARIRVCDAPECGWMYVDRSRNRLRRWCQMETCGTRAKNRRRRSEEHTSELQSRQYLVCRLLLEKTKKYRTRNYPVYLFP